jgi:hypothetical protein
MFIKILNRFKIRINKKTDRNDRYFNIKHANILININK